MLNIRGSGIRRSARFTAAGGWTIAYSFDCSAFGYPGNFQLFVGSSTASAVAGYGTITVPAAYIDGLPIGISFIGGAWDEPQMIAFGYDFEQATHVRVPPTFVPTIGPNTTAGPAVASRADRAALPGRGGRSVMMPVR